MTQGDYLKSMEQIANKKEQAANNKERKRLEAEVAKVKRAADKRKMEQGVLERKALQI